MTYCKRYGKELNDDARYRSACGEDQSHTPEAPVPIRGDILF